MRKMLLGAVIVLLIVFGLRYCEHNKDQKEQLEANTALIQKELKNVGKLIVTEGSYAQVFTYEDWKKFYLDVFSARKKALIVVNAKATIAYDLSKIKTEVNKETKTVTITYIPEPELNINPNIEYYDVQQDYLNQFEAEFFLKYAGHTDTKSKPVMISTDRRYTKLDNIWEQISSGAELRVLNLKILIFHYI